MNERIMPPIHPGEILREEFLTPLGISPNSLATRLGIPSQRIYEILSGKRSISLDTALRLAKFFGTTREFWLRLQDLYEFQRAQDQGLPEKVDREVAAL